jgi:hypothetical protein
MRVPLAACAHVAARDACVSPDPNKKNLHAREHNSPACLQKKRDQIEGWCLSPAHAHAGMDFLVSARPITVLLKTGRFCRFIEKPVGLI